MSRHPDCPDVHLGSCPKCERLWKRDAVRPRPVHDRPAVGTSDAGQEGGSSDPSGVSLEDSGFDAPPKALTPAQKQRAYRERKKASDPDWMKREAERKRRKRQEQKDG